MADNFIQPPANTGVGLKVDTSELVVGANTVERQRIVLADPAGAAALAAVSQFNNTDGNAATSYGMQNQAANALFNGATWDRQRSAPGTTGVPSVNSEGTKATYSVAGLVTPPATPTDMVILNGSGTKTVRVLRVEVSLTGTAAGIADVILIKRSTANSGGTATTPNVVPHDSSDAAGTAVVQQYSANPAGVGTVVGNVRAAKMGISAADVTDTIIWDFTKNNDKGIVLRGTAQGLAINLNGDALITGEVLAYSITWSEE